MLGEFYIIKQREAEWYLLCLKSTHYCIACGADFQKLLNTAKKYVLKYKTIEKVKRMFAEFEDEGKVSKSTAISRENEYNNHGWTYDEIIDDFIRSAVSEVQEEARRNSPFNKMKSRIVPVVQGNTPKEKISAPVPIPAPAPIINPVQKARKFSFVPIIAKE